MESANRAIDVKKMEKIGKTICMDYKPLLELARANLNNNVFNTKSIIKVNKNINGKNPTEEMLIECISFNENDPTVEFLKICQKIKQVDTQCENFLIERYFYGKSEEEIIYSEFNGSKRTYYKIRNKAHYQVAYLTGNIIYKN